MPCGGGAEEVNGAHKLGIDCFLGWFYFVGFAIVNIWGKFFYSADWLARVVKANIKYLIDEILWFNILKN